MPSILNRLTQAILAGVLLVQMFFLVDGPTLFPSYWASQGWNIWLPIYLLLTLGALVLSGPLGIPTAPSQTSFAEVERSRPFSLLGFFPFNILLFIVGFMLAFLLFNIPGVSPPVLIPVGDIWPTFLFTTFVIAFGEEMVFRGVINAFLYQFMSWWCIPLSSAAWTAYHFAAYHATPGALPFLFAFGLVLGTAHIVSMPFGGISVCWGAHDGWNLGATGALAVKVGTQALRVLLGGV